MAFKQLRAALALVFVALACLAACAQGELGVGRMHKLHVVGAAHGLCTKHAAPPAVSARTLACEIGGCCTHAAVGRAAAPASSPDSAAPLDSHIDVLSPGPRSPPAPGSPKRNPPPGSTPHPPLPPSSPPPPAGRQLKQVTVVRPTLNPLTGPRVTTIQPTLFGPQVRVHGWGMRAAAPPALFGPAPARSPTLSPLSQTPCQ